MELSTRMKKTTIKTIAAVSLIAPLTPIFSTVASASEPTEKTSVTMEKSFEQKTIAELTAEATERYRILGIETTAPQEGLQNEIAKALEAKVMNMTVAEVQANMSDLMKEFEGAAYQSARVAGVGGVFQNGGWNMYYNSSSGKKAVYNFYNRLVLGTGGNAIYNVILDALAATCGITPQGAIVIAIGNLVAGALVAKAISARGLVTNHGNVGTVRVILSDQLWSSTYNAKW